MSDSAQPVRIGPSGDSQAVEPKRNRTYPKRVPSSLPAVKQREAVLEFRMGRSAHQIAADKSVAVPVVLELVIRDLAEQVQKLRRAA